MLRFSPSPHKASAVGIIVRFCLALHPSREVLNRLFGVILAISATGCDRAQSAVQIVFEQERMSVGEDAGTIEIPMRLLTPNTRELRVPLRFGGSAQYQRDYSTSAVLVIPPHTQTFKLSVSINDDQEAECPETLAIELEAASDVIAVARRNFVVTIADNDRTDRVLRVGPGERYELPGAAAEAAQNGDVVDIAAGTYKGDVAVWRAHDVLICGLGAGAQLEANGKAAEGKAIWVIKGDRVRVENVGFSGAKVSGMNGAGIRAEGNDLTVRQCRFTNNENGILAGDRGDSTITVEHSEFTHNGAGDGRSHNIYVGKIKRLEIRYSTLQEALVGHQVKSRARETWIEYSRMMDGAGGRGSYEVDVPNGGRVVLVGNVIQKGADADNWTLIAYGAEGVQYTDSRLYVANNTLVNDRNSGVFVQAPKDIPCMLFNNVFAGKADIACASVRQEGNVKIDSGFVDRMRFDYRLLRDSKAVDAGMKPSDASGIDLTPHFEYFASGMMKPRTPQRGLDAGAYEYTGR